MQARTFDLTGAKAWETPSLPHVPEGFYEGVISALHDVRPRDASPQSEPTGVRIHVQITGGEQNGRQVVETLWFPKASDTSDSNRGKLAALAKSLGRDVPTFVLSDGDIGKIVRFHYRPKDEEAGIKESRTTFQSLAVWTSSRAAAGLTNTPPPVVDSQLNAALSSIVQGVVAPVVQAPPVVEQPIVQPSAPAFDLSAFSPAMLEALRAQGVKI